METAAQKLTLLSRDIRKARIEIEQRPDAGHFLGVGATIRIPTATNTRFVSIYGSDVPQGLKLTFFENNRPLPLGELLYRPHSNGAVSKHGTAPPSLPISLFQQSREFSRPSLRIDDQTSHGKVSRNEIVYLDDALRHAISQAATYHPTGLSAKILAHKDIRLPIREFNKRLPDHSNALRMWLKYRDLALPPETQRLASGLHYSLEHIKGTEYEGSVALSIAGSLQEFTDSTRHPDGPLIRMHSACSFSERGRKKSYVDNLEHDTAYCQTLNPIERPYVSFVETPNEECDCRLQMEESQRLIALHGGIFADFYEQEGRGYGLLNKEEFFYRLFEEEGLNTAEICTKYNINPDIRAYSAFVSWLLAKGIRRVRLLGNNPRKRQALERAGITVTPIGLWLPTEQNIEYLRTKRDLFAHDIPLDPELNTYMSDPLMPFRIDLTPYY